MNQYSALTYLKIPIRYRIQMRRCANLLKRFPDADEEALQEKFPIVDIKMVKRWKRVLGHHNNHQYDVHVNTKNPYGFK